MAIAVGRGRRRLGAPRRARAGLTAAARCALVVGGAIGAVARARVEMTGMPELVAMLHSFVGLAAVLVGFALVPRSPARARSSRGAEARRPPGRDLGRRARRRGHVHRLGGRVGQAARDARRGKPLLLPGAPRAATRCCALALRRRWRSRSSLAPCDRRLPLLLAMTVLAGVLGVHLVHGDRRRRHAGRGVAAQQLLGLGRGGGGLHARQRSADRHRRAGRLERRDPLLSSCAAR